ncbi:NlpC/P60 family protein [Escherichia coli]
MVFFKTGSGQNGLHVGIYDTNNQFIHASTSKGVMRSSLDNVYWQKNLLATINLVCRKMDGDDTSPSIYS